MLSHDTHHRGFRYLSTPGFEDSFCAPEIPSRKESHPSDPGYVPKLRRRESGRSRRVEVFFFPKASYLGRETNQCLIPNRSEWMEKRLKKARIAPGPAVPTPAIPQAPVGRCALIIDIGLHPSLPFVHWGLLQTSMFILGYTK